MQPSLPRTKKDFLAGATRKIPSRHDGPILPARVANQDLIHFARSRIQPYNKLLYYKVKARINLL